MIYLKAIITLTALLYSWSSFADKNSHQAYSCSKQICCDPTNENANPNAQYTCPPDTEFDEGSALGAHKVKKNYDEKKKSMQLDVHCTLDSGTNGPPLIQVDTDNYSYNNVECTPTPSDAPNKYGPYNSTASKTSQNSDGSWNGTKVCQNHNGKTDHYVWIKTVTCFVPESSE